MPATFEKLGISFQYPENWTLDEQDALAGRKSVTVYSPGGAFWTVAVHSKAADPAELARDARAHPGEQRSGLMQRQHPPVAGDKLPEARPGPRMQGCIRGSHDAGFDALRGQVFRRQHSRYSRVGRESLQFAHEKAPLWSLHVAVVVIEHALLQAFEQGARPVRG